MLLGIARPVLIWPERISERLDDAHLETILAHEVWHVRRHDNLAAALHLVVEAIFGFHPVVGWLGGQGEFYTQDTLNGRLRYNRYIWSKRTTNSPHFEESWSDDGRKTWEVDNITDMTRISEDSVKPYVAPTGVSRQIQMRQRWNGMGNTILTSFWRLAISPEAPPESFNRFYKVGGIRGYGHGIKIWNGRANLDEFEGDGATGHIRGLTLRTYNPKTHQWSLYWANSKDGKMVVPQIGQFKDGRGEFDAQDMLNGKSIFVRFV